MVEANLIHRVNVGDILRRTSSRYPNQIAVQEGERQYTYREFNEIVNQAANGLESIGLERGDRLALISSNSIEFLQVYFACAKLGITFIPVNLSLLPHEVAYILEDSSAKALIIEDTHAYQLEKLMQIATLQTVIVIGNISASEGQYADWFTFYSYQKGAEVISEVTDRDLMQCLYTSGTTSNPKGVMSSHLAVYMNTLGTAFDLQFTSKDISIAMLPMHHVAQLNAITTPVMMAGGTVVIMKKFEPIELMTLIENVGATQIFGLPMMYRTLLDHPERQNYNLSTLRLCVYAMAVMPDHEIKRAIETFQCDFALLFGQTEMAPVATVFRPEHQLTKSGSVGLSGVNVDVSIMDENGFILPTGEIGEIVYRSPQLMEGYLNDQAKTDEAFQNNWFHSGDYGYLDEDAILWFVDRKKDMVKTGGVNVSSIEVEKVIFQNPHVENVAVVGMPHTYWTEALTAFVIPKEGETVTEDEIITLCKKQLGGYKVPKKVLIVDVFPVTSTGKIQKHALRKTYSQLYEEVQS